MEMDKIPATDFCTHHRIEVSFLHSLQEYGLLELDAGETAAYLHPEQVSTVERLIRLHYDLHINLEGLDVINQLLQRMEDMQKKMTALQSRLRFYEDQRSI